MEDLQRDGSGRYPGKAERTRIAFVGAGSVAQRHVSVLSGFEDVELVGVTDPAPGAAQALADGAGMRVAGSVDALLDLEPDAVYVCVPPFAHGDPERALLERGVPFFVEKPLAAELAVAEEIAAGVRDAGLITATGYHWRYLDGVERARALLAETPARLAVGQWMDKVPPVAWWSRRELSGGQVLEQATHLLDVMVALVGAVDRVYAVGARLSPAGEDDADIDEVGSATLTFASGAVGSLASTSLLRAKHRAAVELYCDGRRLELSETELVVDDGNGPVVHADPGEAKRRVDRAFVDAVQGGEDADVRAPYDVALETHRVGWALVRSAREHAELELTA